MFGRAATTATKKINRGFEGVTSTVPIIGFKIRIILGFIPELILTFVRRFITPIIVNIVAIISLLLIIFLFVFLAERHLNQSVEFVADASDLSVDFGNLVGYLCEVLFEVFMLTVPLANGVIRFSMIIAIKIYDGLFETLNDSPFFGGRRLEEIGSYAFFVVAHKITALILAIGNVYLILITSLLDLIFALHILDIMLVVIDIIVILSTKVMCGFAGTWCFVLELLDFIVYDLIVAFINIIAFGAIPVTHDIACGAQVLTEMGIGLVCAGSVMSVEPPGLFRHAQNDRRRMLITCSEQSGEFREIVDSTLHHSTQNRSEACPHIRSSFNLHGNALNHYLLDSHDCYEMCVRNILIKSCSDGSKTFIGSCGKITRNLTYREASRRLTMFVGSPTKLSQPTRVQSSYESTNKQTLSRQDLIDKVKNRVGQLVFSASFGICDLTTPPTTIFETAVDSMCLWSKLSPERGFQETALSIFDTKPDRRQLKTRQENKALKVLEWAHHHRRIAKHQHSYSTPHPRQLMDDPIAIFRELLNTPHCKHTCPGTKNCVDHIEDCKSKRMNPQVSKRRRLDTLCEPGFKLCPNEYQCVVDILKCNTNMNLSTMGIIRNSMVTTGSGLQNVHPSDIARSIYTCWKNYEKNRNIDPYFGANLLASQDDLNTRCIWCTPMIQPFDWEFKPYTKSLRKDIYDTCTALSDDFAQCQCPMFYSLLSTTEPYYQFISADLAYILLNGLIWFKNLFVFLTFGIFGDIWSSLFPYPTFSMGLSRALSLYSDRIPLSTYAACQGLKTGSACLVILFVAILVACLRLYWDMFMFVSSGGIGYASRQQRDEANRIAQLNSEADENKREEVENKKKIIV
jgi:hypothetical protein